MSLRKRMYGVPYAIISNPIEDLYPLMAGLYINDPTTMTLGTGNAVTEWRDLRGVEGLNLNRDSTLVSSIATHATWNSTKKAIIFNSTLKNVIRGYMTTGTPIEAVVMYLKVPNYPSSFGGLINGSPYGFLLQSDGYILPVASMFNNNVRVNNVSTRLVPLNTYSTITGFNTGSTLNQFENGFVYLGRGDEDSRYADFELKGFAVLTSPATTAELIRIENYFKTLP